MDVIMKKTLAVTLSTFALVACNGEGEPGSGSSSGLNGNNALAIASSAFSEKDEFRHEYVDASSLARAARAAVTEECQVSGTVSVDSTAESIVVTYDQCVQAFESYQWTTHGSFTFEGTGSSGSVSGGLLLTAGNESVEVKNFSMTLSLNEINGEFTESFGYTYVAKTTEFTGTLTVNTDQPFVYLDEFDNFPNSGQLSVESSDGSSVVVTVVRADQGVSVVINGASAVTHTWEEFDDAE